MITAALVASTIYCVLTLYMMVLLLRWLGGGHRVGQRGVRAQHRIELRDLPGWARGEAAGWRRGSGQRAGWGWWRRRECVRVVRVRVHEGEGA